MPPIQAVGGNAVVRTVAARVTRATVHPTPRRRLVLAELDAPQRPTISIENVPAAASPAAVALEVLGTAFVFAAFLTAVLYL